MPQPPMLQPQPPLPPIMKHSRTNLGDLKSLITKRLGQERAQRYFSYLNDLLSQKLSKREFSKLCILTLGHENLPFHNQLISSILQNASRAKAPPPVHHDKFAQMPTGIVLNGDVLPRLPHKIRSRTDNHRVKDCPSPLGPNGRAEVSAQLSSIPYNTAALGQHDDLNSSDLQRLIQQQQCGPHKQPTKRARIDETPVHDQGAVHSPVLAEVVSVDQREDIEHWNKMASLKGPLQAPLGIPFCSASVGGARTPLSSGSANIDRFHRSYDSSELYHTEVLKKRMEKIAKALGLEGVTMDCANLLNNGLDVYLKRLIGSCIELVGVRTRHESTKQPFSNLLPFAQPENGICVGSQMHGNVGLEGTHVLSMQDFKVAMEVKPQQLGEDWPMLLEKIYVRSFEE
ncbi:uncharacterized protein LOC135625572 [Musa acuminata AAA Group]|uniref:(wild Malaysian banana) hypothetical protein n=1 Tax=Musa acuminata subsp. malaccensis TaxID=214687 RepID=A0A804L289_MUSAM|nr:PREDICTED: uncharacterized protein LOC103969686 [Musa acuminata subsp. malaccensis]XP_009381587.1 PREDICTED: uncharacterized protein LOC103969686 [Musa acuminata subsp. malaccensis]XP_009381588.1 PREDICTED: uncharacterized protein LOC103969686 [Musa acuminata subsp. malaccensis]CAG1855098.1 unnamed protein product [Musa acuminata subsp. malaccensis]